MAFYRSAQIDLLLRLLRPFGYCALSGLARLIQEATRLIILVLILLSVLLFAAGFVYSALLVVAVIPLCLALGLATVRGLRSRTNPAPRADTASTHSQQASGEHDRSIPQDLSESLTKVGDEAAAEEGVVNKLEAAGRELDRQLSGEYERREDTSRRS